MEHFLRQCGYNFMKMEKTWGFRREIGLVSILGLGSILGSWSKLGQLLTKSQQLTKNSTMTKVYFFM